jgi:hypothetical protein
MLEGGIMQLRKNIADTEALMLYLHGECRTDREKIELLADLLGDTPVIQPKSTKVWGRRFEFNPEGDIVAVQNIVNVNGRTFYKPAVVQ